MKLPAAVALASSLSVLGHHARAQEQAPAEAKPAEAKPKPRTSLAAPPTTRSGNESSEASKEWKTDFHGYFRAPFRVGTGSRPPPNPSCRSRLKVKPTPATAPRAKLAHLSRADHSRRPSPELAVHCAQPQRLVGNVFRHRQRLGQSDHRLTRLQLHRRQLRRPQDAVRHRSGLRHPRARSRLREHAPEPQGRRLSKTVTAPPASTTAESTTRIYSVAPTSSAKPCTPTTTSTKVGTFG